jgi:hypothetical protein
MNWQRLYDELPDDTNHDEFRTAIEAAIMFYEHEAPDPNAPPWKQIVESFEAMLAEVRRINSLYGAVRAGWAVRGVVGTPPRAAFRPYVLNDVLKARAHAAFQLQLECELADKRRERLYANLIAACSRVGGRRPSNSLKGPMTRVLKIILDQVLPHAGHQSGPRKAEGDDSLTASAIKKIVKRHTDRRGGKVLLGGADSSPG